MYYIGRVVCVVCVVYVLCVVCVVGVCSLKFMILSQSIMSHWQSDRVTNPCLSRAGFSGH